MSEPVARVLSRHATSVSPWVTVVRKEIEFAPGQPPEVYHCLAQADYVAILAVTPDGRVPIVRQFRPAVESYTWELPAGLLDAGEEPEAACRRELREETGLAARSVAYVGAFYADTGRLENPLHAFFVRASEPDPAFVEEPNLTVAFVTMEALRDLIRRGAFRHQLHLGVLATAHVAGLWGL